MKTVMLVLESEQLQSCLVALLQASCRVVVCSADQAVCEIDIVKPDVLIMDLMLPGTDGFSILEQAEFYPQATLLLTPFTSDSVCRKASDLGITLLRKPFTATYLLRCLDAMTRT